MANRNQNNAAVQGGRRRRRRATTVATSGRVTRIIAPDQGVIVQRRQIPRFIQGPRSVRVCNTEVLLNINTLALGATSVARVLLMPNSMAWISGVAQNFSKWRWLRVRLVYVPSCSTATSGTFAMGLGYDNQDATGSSLTNVQAMYNSVSCPSWGGADGSGALTGNDFPPITPTTVAMDLDVSRLSLPWYPYSSTVPSGIDANQNVPAYVYLASTGGPAAATAIGQVFCKFEVELIEPIPVILN